MTKLCWVDYLDSSACTHASYTIYNLAVKKLGASAVRVYIEESRVYKVVS